jgi:cytidylate kinase
MAVITVSRQYGSGGDEIVARLCELLNYTAFDKRLLAREASAVGLSEAEVVDAWEDNYKVGGLLERLFSRDVKRTVLPQTWNEAPGAIMVTEPMEVDFDTATRFVRKTIEKAYERCEIIIVGRGGQVVLQDRPGVLHVRIEAPTVVRVSNVQRAEHLDVRQAEERIEQKDHAAAEYLRRYYGVDWTNPGLYHLIVNAARWDTESAARLIADASGRVSP